MKTGAVLRHPGIAILGKLPQPPAAPWLPRHGYLALLPPREYVPALWSEAELALLAGTELQARVPADRAAMAEDWSESIAPLLDKYPRRLSPREAFSLERFGVAASYVASRAFGVDDYHGG